MSSIDFPCITKGNFMPLKWTLSPFYFFFVKSIGDHWSMDINTQQLLDNKRTHSFPSLKVACAVLGEISTL